MGRSPNTAHLLLDARLACLVHRPHSRAAVAALGVDLNLRILGLGRLGADVGASVSARRVHPHTRASERVRAPRVWAWARESCKLANTHLGSAIACPLSLPRRRLRACRKGQDLVIAPTDRVARGEKGADGLAGIQRVRHAAREHCAHALRRSTPPGGRRR